MRKEIITQAFVNGFCQLLLVIVARQQNLQILIPELIGYLAKQSVFEPGNIAQWIARNLMSEHAQWSMAQAITLLADVERLCPQLVKTPPGGLLQSVDLHPAIKALKDE